MRKKKLLSIKTKWYGAPKVTSATLFLFRIYEILFRNYELTFRKKTK